MLGRLSGLENISGLIILRLISYFVSPHLFSKVNHYVLVSWQNVSIFFPQEIKRQRQQCNSLKETCKCSCTWKRLLNWNMLFIQENNHSTVLEHMWNLTSQCFYSLAVWRQLNAELAMLTKLIEIKSCQDWHSCLWKKSPVISANVKPDFKIKPKTKHLPVK